MKLKPILTALASVLTIGSVPGASAPTFISGVDPCPKGMKWERVEPLSDEFAGDSVDRSKWQIEPVASGWVWDGRPPGLFRAENVTVKDGKLRVTVGVLEKPLVIKRDTFTYQGGIVRALKPGHVGWYYECRMKANSTEMSSTFWLMTKGDTVKKLELDIQECVGKTTERTEAWAGNWDRIFHSNAIHRRNRYNPESKKLQAYLDLEEKNRSRYFVYGAWWKSPKEIRFYLDGKYIYSIHPEVAWDVPAFLHMAIETYDWNPVPEGGGMVASGTVEERTTKYDWIRTWKLVEQ